MWSGEKDEEVIEMNYSDFWGDMIYYLKKTYIRIFFSKINYRVSSVLIYFSVPKAIIINMSIIVCLSHPESVCVCICFLPWTWIFEAGIKLYYFTLNMLRSLRHLLYILERFMLKIEIKIFMLTNFN